MKAKPKLTIEIVSDIVWPWCFIGKRRLESALRMYQERLPDGGKPAVRWLPFQLNPDLPAEGIPRQEYLKRKFGPGHSHSYARVAGVGREVGINFAFDHISVQPNTLNAHRLMIYGAKQGREHAVAEHLFRAYFLEGANLTDTATLASVGARASLDRVALTAYLASDDGREEVLRADREARQAGINGMPFFMFNHRTAVSGAQAPETLLQAMLEARPREGD